MMVPINSRAAGLLASMRQSSDGAARELVDYIDALGRGLGSVNAQVERQKEREERAHREAALMRQELASVSNVKHNADLQRVAALRDRADAESLLAAAAEYVSVSDRRLLDAVNAYLDRRDLRMKGSP